MRHDLLLTCAGTGADLEDQGMAVMDEEYFQRRHTQLWEDRTKRVGRVVIASLLFGALLQLNVPGSWSRIYKRQIVLFP
ncbi:MAG: hypothetical protein ACLFVT_09270 [Syntrophobacteria bacterium]